MKMSMERELLYAQTFPFVDYGCDLQEMANYEKGIRLQKLKKSDYDAAKTEKVDIEVECYLNDMRSRKADKIPIDFHGKGGSGYLLYDHA